MSQASAQTSLGSSGQVHRCGLKFLNTAFPRPMGRKLVISDHTIGYEETEATKASLSIIHISKIPGQVKPKAPLLARRKRMSTLMSVSRFWLIPGCEAHETTLYTKLRLTGRALIINHKTLLFNRSLDHLSLRRATWAIHSVRLISIDI